MSRLARALETVRGEDHKIWPGPFGITVRQEAVKLEWQQATAYEVRALFAARVFVRDPGTITDEQTRDAKQHILEEVFGEFRRPIMQVQVALHELDINKAQELLDTLLTSMFEPGDPRHGGEG